MRMHEHLSLYSSVVERQSCKLKVLGSIPSGGFECTLPHTLQPDSTAWQRCIARCVPSMTASKARTVAFRTPFFVRAARWAQGCELQVAIAAVGNAVQSERRRGKGGAVN